MCKRINPFDNCLKQLLETWDNKLIFTLTELGKRYLGEDLGILLDRSTGQGPLCFGERFSLTVSYNRPNGIDACPGWNHDVSTRAHKDQLPMLVTSVHVMDNKDRIVCYGTASLVWLHFFDESTNIGVCDSLYFSLVTGQFICRGRLLP